MTHEACEAELCPPVDLCRQSFCSLPSDRALPFLLSFPLPSFNTLHLALHSPSFGNINSLKFKSSAGFASADIPQIPEREYLLGSSNINRPRSLGPENVRVSSAFPPLMDSNNPYSSENKPNLAKLKP